MTVTLTWQSVVTAGAVLGSLATIITLLVRVVRWMDRQKQQDKEIEKLREHHEADISEIRKELALLVFGQLACLKGLQEQGCDGSVTEAVQKIEKHLNKMAHREEV